MQEYFTGKWTWQKDKKDATWREMEDKGEKKNEKRERKEKPTKELASTQEHASTKLTRRSNNLMDPTPVNVYNG